MLVQLNLSDVWETETEYAGEAFCTLCGDSIGTITKSELRGLLFASNSDVLCFKCEVLRPKATKPMKQAVERKLLELFGVESVTLLPTSCCPQWQTSDLSAFLQLQEGEGWRLWWQEPDGSVSLKRVKLSYRDADAMRHNFAMLPMQPY